MILHCKPSNFTNLYSKLTNQEETAILFWPSHPILVDCVNNEKCTKGASNMPVVVVVEVVVVLSI